MFLGASGFDPRSLLEKLGDALDAVGAWFREKLSIATSDPHAEVSDHYVANSAQFAVQTIVGDYFGTPKDWEGEATAKRQNLRRPLLNSPLPDISWDRLRAGSRSREAGRPLNALRG